MFAQVFMGKAKDASGLRKQMDAWMQDLKPGAQGFLGSTAGVATDGTFVGVARFESEEAARKNSERPEQGEWWSQTEQYLEDPSFIDASEVNVTEGGGSDDAGFVQVMMGRTSDPDELRELSKQFEDFGDIRPDVIGGLSLWPGDGRFVEVNYFTSEQEAREGEKQDLPEKFQQIMTRFGELADDLTYLDITDPWLYS